MMKYYIPFLLLIFMMSSCKKDNSSPVRMGYYYFPTIEGQYKIFDVMQIIHDHEVSVHDTLTYQIKEVIGESYEDLEGEQAQKIYRYYRQNDTLNWSIKDVWNQKLTTKTAQVVEENKRQIKMAFGISYNQYWDCNALNADDKKECYYANITDPYQLDNGIIIDSTAIVEQSNFLTFIDYTRSFEVYAADIGKIYSYNKDFTINNTDTLNPIKGTELFYSMVEYGN